MKEVVVVLGYGPKLNTDIKKYLGYVATFLGTHRNAIVITAGGRTFQKSMPDISEASMMKEALLSFGVKNYITCEEESITTIENLNFISEHLYPFICDSASIIVICDTLRLPKVRYIAKKIFFGKSITLIPFHFSHSWREYFAEWFVGFPLAVLACHSSFFAMYLRYKRLELNRSR